MPVLVKGGDHFQADGFSVGVTNTARQEPRPPKDYRPVGQLLPTGAKEISPATSEFALIRVNLCSSVANPLYFPAFLP